MAMRRRLNEKRPVRAVARARAMMLINRKQNTTKQPRRQVVTDLLSRGKEGAQTAADLARMLGWSRRKLSKQIEFERRHGSAILATTDTSKGVQPGYFLPANSAEIDGYLASLQHRESEIRKTRAAVAASRQITVDDLKGGGSNG